MPLSSSGYFFPGSPAPPAYGSGVGSTGRGPMDVWLIGSNITLSATLSASDGTTNVELVSLSGTTYSNSSSFTGDQYSIVFGPQDVQFWSNIAVTVINNSSNNIKSGSVEWSPDNVAWERDWETTTFSNLTSSVNAAIAASGTVRSMQISDSSRRYLRLRLFPSGAGGALTGSTNVVVTVNNG